MHWWIVREHKGPIHSKTHQSYCSNNSWPVNMDTRQWKISSNMDRRYYGQQTTWKASRIVIFEELDGWPNLKTLFDIFEWSEISGHWMRWQIGEPQAYLLPYVQLFFDGLKGCTPWNIVAMDCRGWGLMDYSVKGGYLSMLQTQPLP